MSQLNSTGKTLLGISALILLSAIYLYYCTYSFPPPVVPNTPGPATLPRMVLIGIFVCLPFVIYDIFKRHRAATAESVNIEYKEIAFTLVLVVLFSMSLDRLGFEIVGAFVMLTSLWATTRNLKLSIILTVGGILACYVIFVALLKVYIQTSFLPMHPLQFLGY